MKVLVNGPGLYRGLDERRYHADDSLAPGFGPSLSSTGAKRLLDSPARFDWERTHPPEPREEFDLGHAVHGVLLGVGSPLEVVEADSWRTKAAQEKKAAARAAGRIPLLPPQHAAVHNMKTAVRLHPLAGRLLDGGEPEVSAYWRDAETGVTCRARMDYLRASAIVDLKTAESASPEGFARSVGNYAYHSQAAWYQEAVQVLTGALLPYALVVVEKVEPYLVAVYELDQDAMDAGRARNQMARERFRDCLEAGVWPGYTDLEPAVISLPRWAS